MLIYRGFTDHNGNPVTAGGQPFDDRARAIGELRLAIETAKDCALDDFEETLNADAEPDLMESELTYLGWKIKIIVGRVEE